VHSDTCTMHLSLICAQGWVLCVPKNPPLVCYVCQFYVGLSSIKWRASNRQGRPRVGVAWSSCSSMQGLHGEGRGLCYSRQACCDVPASMNRYGTMSGDSSCLLITDDDALWSGNGAVCRWALPEPMAQAGFYYQPSSTGDDRAMCFTCNVCLVCWEPTDEPWFVNTHH